MKCNHLIGTFGGVPVSQAQLEALQRDNKPLGDWFAAWPREQQQLKPFNNCPSCGAALVHP